MSSNNIVLSGTVELNFSSSGTDYLNPQSVDSTTGEFTPINLYGGEVYTGADFVITESQILSQYSSVDGSALSIQSIEFRDAENNLISLDYDATTGTYTRPFDGTDANYTNGVSVSYVIADENGGTSNIQYAYFFDTDNNNNSIVFNEEVLGSSEVTYETYDSVAGEYVDTAFNPSDVIDVSLNAGYDIKGYLPQVSADGTLTVTKSQLTDLFTDTDGDAISLLFGNGGFLVVGFNENEEYLDTPPPQVNANFAPGEDSITLDLSEFAQYDSVKLYVNVAGGADGAFVGLDVAFESSAPVIEAGVEGEDFIYANALDDNRNNNAIKKRGEDSITGDYWVNSRDSSLDDTLVDGGEYAMVMGIRGELTTDITGEQLADGLASGDFVATKSFTSYGGYAANVSFEDGAIDSLVQSTGGEFNQLMVGRIDVETGELVGGLKRISGTEVWENFNVANSLSGRNDNAFGDILEQQSQTGGF